MGYKSRRWARGGKQIMSGMVSAEQVCGCSQVEWVAQVERAFEFGTREMLHATLCETAEWPALLALVQH